MMMIPAPPTTCTSTGTPPSNSHTTTSTTSTITGTHYPTSTAAPTATMITPMTTTDVSSSSGCIHHYPMDTMMMMTNNNDDEMTMTQSQNHNGCNNEYHHPMHSSLSSPLLLPSTPTTTNTTGTTGTSSGSSTYPPPAPPPPQSQYIDLYVVQKCWYSGPQITTPTLDYMRLLRNKEDAEQIAYHSAHLFATAMAASQSNPASPHHNIVVRTITLPASNSTTSTSSSSSLNHSTTTTENRTIPLSNHAFVAAGQLFWIRRIRAQIVNHPTDNNRHNTNDDCHFDHAHCIVTNGIIGGNGYNNVRRRQFDESSSHTLPPIRVFVGSQSAHAALQLIVGNPNHTRNASAPIIPLPVGSTVQWIPVGSPPSPTQILNEWSNAAHMTTSSSTTTTTTMDDQNGFVTMNDQTSKNHSTYSKRTLQDTDMSMTNGTVWYNTKPKNTNSRVTTTTTTEHQNHDPFIWRPSPPPAPAAVAVVASLPRPTKRPCCRPMGSSSSMELSTASSSYETHPLNSIIMDHTTATATHPTMNDNMMMME